MGRNVGLIRLLRDGDAYALVDGLFYGLVSALATMRPVNWAPLVVAFAALAFTILSFWWMNWRHGHLIVFEPASYGATTVNDRLLLLFPFVFFNTGPVPIVVRHLRVRFADEVDGVPLGFERIRTGVSPTHATLVDLASGFPVPGNQTVKLFCEFGRGPVGRATMVGDHNLVLEALIDSDRQWHPLFRFKLRVDADSAEKMAGHFIAFENVLLDRM